MLMVAALLLLMPAAALADGTGRRDVLWQIVSSCLNPEVAGYCKSCPWPLTGTSCAAGLSCRETTELWAQTDAYVVLRDRKACDCPDGFVHGLAIPRGRVTGVEDSARPDGIWPFAWATALKRIADPSAAALMVNSAATRAQDQLHVHILRLKKDAREKFASAWVGHVQKLAGVWQTAGKLAAAAGFDDYGVLVAKATEGGFLVVVDQASPEKKYGIDRCR